MPRPDYIPEDAKPSGILEKLTESMRYKVVDADGNVKGHYAQWPHDYTLGKGWKIIDKRVL